MRHRLVSRRFTTVLTAVALTATAAACGSDESGSSSNSTAVETTAVAGETSAATDDTSADETTAATGATDAVADDATETSDDAAEEPTTTQAPAAGTTDPAFSAETTTTTTLPGGPTGAPSIDVSSLIGSWKGTCRPYPSNAGSNDEDVQVALAADGVLQIVLHTVDYTDQACGGGIEGEVTLVMEMAVDVSGEVAGITQFAGEQTADPECTSNADEVCGLALQTFIPGARIGLGLDNGNLVIADPSSGADDQGLVIAWLDGSLTRA